MSLEQRIERLERSARVWRAVAVGAVVVAAVVGMGPDEKTERTTIPRLLSDSIVTQTLSAERIVLSPGGVIVVLSEEEHRHVVAIGASEEGHGFLETNTKDGRRLVRISASSGERPVGAVIAHDPESLRPAAVLAP